MANASAVDPSNTAAVGTTASPGAHVYGKHVGDPGGAKKPLAHGWHVVSVLGPTEKVLTCGWEGNRNRLA